MKSKHLVALTREKQMAQVNTLFIILDTIVDVIGTLLVRQRQLPFKTPFPIFVIEPDDDDDNGGGGIGGQ